MTKDVENKSNITNVLANDLVTLAALANNLIMKGSFKGEDAQEVQDVLNMCQNVHKTLVKKDKDEV